MLYSSLKKWSVAAMMVIALPALAARDPLLLDDACTINILNRTIQADE